MNSFPFFGVSSVQAFYDQTRANAPDPATGKPNPAIQAAFVAAHPEFARFAAWAKEAPWSTSWANTTYNGINTFRFINAAGELRNVRWSMQPQTPFAAMTPEQREAADGNFLSEDLQARLARGPLRWDMLVTVAHPRRIASLARTTRADQGGQRGGGTQQRTDHGCLPRYQL